MALFLLIIGIVVLVADFTFPGARLRGHGPLGPGQAMLGPGQAMTAITKPGTDSAAGTVR
jgi:hypothetical protein